MAIQHIHLFTLLITLITGCEAGCYFSTRYTYVHSCYLSDGAIAGIVIGCIVGVGVLIAICVGCYTSNRRNARLCRPTLSYNAHYYHPGYGYPAAPVATIPPASVYPHQPPAYVGPLQADPSAPSAQKY